MVDISMLPTLCSTAFQNERQNTVVRCILKNFRGPGPYYESVNARRRRSLFGLLELDMITKAQPVSSVYRSYCIRKRSAKCNALYNNPTANFVEWTPISTELKYSIVNSNNTYTILSSSKVFGVRSSLAVTIAKSFDLSIKTQNEITTSCRFIGQRSQNYVAKVFATQSSKATNLQTLTDD
ncbi:unnamed protein product [Rotaria magnacalcarata]